MEIGGQTWHLLKLICPPWRPYIMGDNANVIYRRGDQAHKAEQRRAPSRTGQNNKGAFVAWYSRGTRQF